MQQLSEWFYQLLDWIQYLAQTLPPTLFVIIGAALEEIIAIIPSAAVLVAVGTVVATQQGTFLQIVWLSVLSGFVKTVISYVFYVIADKIEDKIPAKVLRLVGYKKGEAEQFGKHLSKGWKDAVILVVLRTLPIVPSLPVSLICGFLKTDRNTYLWTSMVGFTIKSALYIVAGYAGLELLQAWL